MRSTLIERCKRESITDVYFPGWLDGVEKISYYAISDIFVLPTLSDVWAMVINEAMACGLPIVTTSAAGSSKDLVKNGENGFVVEPKNSKQLESAIGTILSSDEELNRMGIKSLEFICNGFSMDNSIAGFRSAINYAANQGKI